MSAFGTPVSALAVQIVVVVDLQATATEVGIVRAAQWLPYLVCGLLAGALVDRVRRRLRMLWLCDLGRAATLAAIPLLHAAGLLTIMSLIAVLLTFGALSVLNDAGSQSSVPRLVERSSLAAGYARLEQSGAVAQTAGPALAGTLVRLFGAPVALLVDAVTFVGSAALLRSISVTEPAPSSVERRHLLREIHEGARWVYTHKMLAPMAIWSHAWFFFNAVLSVVFVPYAVRDLGLDALSIGIAYAAAGAGAVAGGAMSGVLSRRLHVGGTDIAAYAVLAVAYVPVVLAVPGPAALPLLVVGQLLFGLGAGLSSPVTLAYRQAVTPDRLRARMNATIRSLNWGMIAVAAPLGGLLADVAGFRAALWAGIAGVTIVAFGLSLSPFRRATMPSTARV